MTHQKSGLLAVILSAYPKIKRLSKPTNQDHFLKFEKTNHFVSLYISEMSVQIECQKQFFDNYFVRICILITTLQKANQKLISQQEIQQNLVYLLCNYFITNKITLL